MSSLTWMKKICSSPVLLALLAIVAVLNYASLSEDIYTFRLLQDENQPAQHIADLEEKNKELKNEIEVLQYQLKMKEARDTSFVVGPMKLSCLSPTVTDMFGEHNMRNSGVDSFSENIISKNQVPEIAHKHMTYVGLKEGWTKKWTTALIDDMVRAVKNKEDVSCRDYPKSMEQIQTGLDRIVSLLHTGDSQAKTEPVNILVAGSVSPWVEATVLGHPSIQLYNDRVITTDYQDIDMEDSKHRIEFVHMEQLKKKPFQPLFDVIISYSSIEHDGLGRYGDPINPRGDFAAMQEYSLMMKDGGFFLLGVPISQVQNGEAGFTVFNGHRLYSNDRFHQLIKDFEQVGDRIVVPGLRDWQQQPVTILRKPFTKKNT